MSHIGMHRGKMDARGWTPLGGWNAADRNPEYETKKYAPDGTLLTMTPQTAARLRKIVAFNRSPYGQGLAGVPMDFGAMEEQQAANAQAMAAAAAAAAPVPTGPPKWQPDDPRLGGLGRRVCCAYLESTGGPCDQPGCPWQHFALPPNMDTRCAAHVCSQYDASKEYGGCIKHYKRNKLAVKRIKEGRAYPLEGPGHPQPGGPGEWKDVIRAEAMERYEARRKQDKKEAKQAKKRQKIDAMDLWGDDQDAGGDLHSRPADADLDLTDVMTDMTDVMAQDRHERPYGGGAVVGAPPPDDEPTDAGVSYLRPTYGRLAVDDRVRVSEDFDADAGSGVRLKKGQEGTVKDVDGSGDAYIAFDDVEMHLWVFKPNFKKLGVVDTKISAATESTARQAVPQRLQTKQPSAAAAAAASLAYLQARGTPGFQPPAPTPDMIRSALSAVSTQPDDAAAAAAADADRKRKRKAARLAAARRASAASKPVLGDNEC